MQRGQLHLAVHGSATTSPPCYSGTTKGLHAAVLAAICSHTGHALMQRGVLHVCSLRFKNFLLLLLSEDRMQLRIVSSAFVQ